MLGSMINCGRGRFWLSCKEGQAMLDYLVQGCPAPPPGLVKFAGIAHYQALTGYRVFVETGTYLGETLSRAARIFDRCYSVELSQELYARAKAKFSGPRVEVVHGSSAEKLPELLRRIDQPAVIWLDAHFSGGITAGEGSDPLLAELAALVEQRQMRHLVLIDDARGLGVSEAELSRFIKGMGPGYHASLLHDSVRVVPVEVPLLGTPLE